MTRLPHPITGEEFDSPVPPGTGWPDDPAGSDTPVAATAARASSADDTIGTIRFCAPRSSTCLIVTASLTGTRTSGVIG